MTQPTETKPLADEQKREYCLMISIGCDRETACKYLGCSYRQLQEALQHDMQFARQLLRAEATPEFSHMRNLHNAAKDEKHWRASVWWLERCAPDRYARRSPSAIAADELKRVIQDLSDAIVGEIANREDRERLMKRLASIAQAVEVDQSLVAGDHQEPAEGESQES